MKYLYVSLFVLLQSIISINAQVTTYFYGQSKIQSKGQTAALYSVAIYDDYTNVTVELIPTKNRSRMNYWSSINTYIIVNSELELPIVGFLRNDGGKQIIDEAPFAGNWGWDNVKKGQKYYYTMVFQGRIPPGVTNFTLVDRGDSYGSHGYGFSNYTLNNPATIKSVWNEDLIKQYAEQYNDGICGIYEGSDENGYRLGCVKWGEEYFLIYLGGKKYRSWWQVGDFKAQLHPSATLGLFKADWLMMDKSRNSDCYVAFTSGSMKLLMGDEESFYLKMYPSFTASNSPSTEYVKWSGTGFALNNGYIVTNYHVVENAKSIKVQGIRGAFHVKYNAEVVSTDKYNDLAVIKISDNRFQGFGTLPYQMKTSTSDVGESVFVLGYPLTTTMGDEIKLTTGIISSKSGYQGDVSLYQISAPIQPGNSGGPLFDDRGNLIGVINAKHKGAENVSYAIKSSYLNNLLESTSLTYTLPTNNLIADMELSEKVKSLKNFVFMITCSNNPKDNDVDMGTHSYNSVSSNTISHPFVQNTLAKRVTINSVTVEQDYTAVELTTNNMSKDGTYFQWCSIDKNTYILVNGVRYTMTRAEGINISPKVTFFSCAGQDLTFVLYFPPIPASATSMDLIEPVDGGEWKFYGIKLK